MAVDVGVVDDGLGLNKRDCPVVTKSDHAQQETGGLMTNCQGCGADILNQDRFCKNCGAPVAASVEDLADTRPFDPAAPVVAAASTGSLDQYGPQYTPAAAPYSPPLSSAPLPRTQSFIKNLLQRKLYLLLALFLLFLFIGTGAVIGRDVVRARRSQRAEQAREAERAKQSKQLKQAEAARHTFEEAIQNAMGFAPANVLGVEYPELQGVFVSNLTSDDSPAALAHIQAGDVLIELGDQLVRNSGELARVLTSVKPGSEVAVKLYRDDEQVSSRIRIGSPTVPPFQQKIEPRDQGFLGVGDVGRRCCVAGPKRWGLEIHRIVDNSPADLAGLQPGDVITEFDKQTIRTPNELARRIRLAKPRSKVRVKFYRAAAEQTVELTMGHGW
jgi:membrane-associated protease RseP (regulator of RpoE activity)